MTHRREIYVRHRYVCGHLAEVNDVYKYLCSYISSEGPNAQAVSEKAKELIKGCVTDYEKIDVISKYVPDNI